MSNFQVFIGVCVGLACLVGNSDGAVTLTDGSTSTAIVDNTAASAFVFATVAATSDSGTNDYVLTTTPNTFFEIADSASGAISVTAAGAATGSGLVGETAGSTYALVVTVTDNQDNQVHTLTVTLNVVPVFNPTSYTTLTVAHASGQTTNVGTVIATDGDAGDSIAYSLTGLNNDHFDLDSSSGVITVNTGVTIASSDSPYNLKAEATDSRVTATAVVTITVTGGPTNNAPVFSPTTYTFEVANGAVAATTVGAVTITDSDSGDSHTFAIASGNTNNDFAITGSGKVGTIAVAATKTLDKDATSSYQLEVTANDGTDTVTQAVTINFTSNGAAVLVPIVLMMMMCLLFNNV